MGYVRKTRDNSAAVTLFPFLAVLLCTMGGLVVLLVSMAHVSRQQARRERSSVAPPAPVIDAEAARRLNEANEYRQKLEEIRRQAGDSLHQDQLRLGSIDDHVRRLQDRLASLRIAVEELHAKQDQHYDDREQAERELARLTQLIAETRDEIAELREERQGEHASYAIVPYKGPNGTRRTPLYIECQAERVVLQPEGVELSPTDFQPPLGVGNPLAAAIRAAREYLVRDNPDAGLDPDVEPYPLLIVRPEGIAAYYRVREAIRSWDSDFGYEMVDGDWRLEFRAPNPELAYLETQAIETARRRRVLLAQSAPTAFAGEGAGKSFVIDADDGLDAPESPYDPSVLAGAGRQGVRGASDSEAVTQSASGDVGNPLGIGQQERVRLDRSSRESGQPKPGLLTAQEPSEGFPGADGAFGLSAQPDSPDSSSGGSPANALSESETGSPSKTAELGKASSSSLTNSLANEAATGAQGESGSSVPGSPGNPNSGDKSTANITYSAPQKAKPSSARVGAPRGPKDVAIRRHVPIAVYDDRLLIGEAPRRTNPRDTREVVSLPGKTELPMSELIAGIRDHIQEWGMAGQGLYWRPVVTVEVLPGGERRAEQITRMLHQAGVDVQDARSARKESDHATR